VRFVNLRASQRFLSVALSVRLADATSRMQTAAASAPAGVLSFSAHPAESLFGRGLPPRSRIDVSTRGGLLWALAPRTIHTGSPVTPPSFDTFLAASAGVAGALIGLLFVAISVAQERLTGENADQAHRVRASAALTSFSNALAIALFGLVPGVGLRWPGFVVGLLGLSFVAASLLSLRRVRESQPVPPRDTLFLVGLVAAFGLQVFFALRLISNARDVGAARGIAILVIVCFFIGIARAWELVGGPSIAISDELLAIARVRVRDRNTPVTTDQQTGGNADKQ
jgi:hypothetical protein